jgi:segregation and condensation protein A
MLAAADWLERRRQLGRDVFPRGAVKSAPAGREGDLTELLRGCLVALRLPSWVEFYRPRWPEIWQVSDAIARITQLLNESAEGDDFARFLPAIAAGVPARDLQCRAAVASTLVAGLELTRGGTVTLDQIEPWASIRLRSAPDKRAGEAEHDGRAGG